MNASFNRYLGGFSGECGLEPLYKHDTADNVDETTLLESLREAIRTAVQKTGFVPFEKDSRDAVSGLMIERRQVHLFRGQELELPMPGDRYAETSQEEPWLRNIDQHCLAQLDHNQVLVATYRIGHCGGESYDFRLLAVPRGSKLPRSEYHPEPFDQEVNWMSGMDSNSETTVRLPKGTKIWNGKEWEAIAKITYYY